LQVIKAVFIAQKMKKAFTAHNTKLRLNMQMILEILNLEKK
jgi:hypothetical protein